MFQPLSDGFQIRFEKKVWDRPFNALFIHGNVASTEWWLPTFENLQIEALANPQKKGTLLSADWRGYGSSLGLKNKSEVNFDRYAEDFIELLEAQQLKDVHVVGHSTGGMIAMLAVLKKPSLFKSLVLLDSVGAQGLELQLPLEVVLAHFEKISQDKDLFTQVLAATIQGVDAQSPQFQNLVNITWGCDKVSWVTVPEVLSTQIDFRGRMPQLQLPTLILHGEADLVLPLSGSEKLQSQIAGSQLKVLKNHGHSYNLEDPRSFAKELLSFWEASI